MSQEAEEKKARTKGKKEERIWERGRREKEDIQILVPKNTKTAGDLQNH